MNLPGKQLLPDGQAQEGIAQVMPFFPPVWYQYIFIQIKKCPIIPDEISGDKKKKKKSYANMWDKI